MAAPITLNANLNLNPSSVNASAKQVQQALGRITGQASEFQKSLDASTARVFAFGATTSVIQGVSQSFKKLVGTTIAVQAKLVEVNAILGASSAEFSKFRDAIFDAAKKTGQSFNTVADGAAELARQGLSAAETSKRLEAAMILTRISGMDAASSVKALTSALNGFTSAGLTAEEVVNKIVAVDTRFAVSADDLAAGFSRAGSTAEDAGINFNQLLGLITAVEQRTARGGAVIGNAFKSIFTRLTRSSTIEDLQALGVEIDSSQNGIQKLQALSQAIERIGDPTVVSQIKELAGGVYQINVVSSALKDLSSESSIYASATKAAANAGNDAWQRNEELSKSLASQINSLVTSVTSFAEKIGTITFGPLLEDLIGIATKLSEYLDKALDPEKGGKFVQGLFSVIGKFLSGPGIALFTTAFLKIFTMVAKFASDGFKSIMQIGSASERIKSIEAGIVDLLGKDASLRSVLASKTATQAQKEAAIIAAIKQQNTLLAQQQQIVTNIANVAARGGVRGFNSNTGTFGGKGGRRFARGYDPYAAEETEAMMLGASRNVMAYETHLKGFGRAIVNNEEDIVNIGGRDAVIPRYADGYSSSRYSQMLSVARQARTGKFPIAQKPVGDLTAAEANAAAKRGRNVRDLYKEKGKQERQKNKITSIPTLNSSSQYGMIVPETGGESVRTLLIAKNEKGNISALEGNTPSSNTVAKVQVPIYRLNKNELGPKQSQVLQKEFTDIFTKEAIDAAHKMSGGLLPNPVRKSQIESTLNKGSAASAAGSVFESSVAAMLSDDHFADFSNRTTGSLMDFTGNSVRSLSGTPNAFNIPSKTRGIEAKHSSSLAGGAAEKIYKILGQGKEAFSYKSGYKPVARKARGHIPRLSRGHIPRFAIGKAGPSALLNINPSASTEDAKEFAKAINKLGVEFQAGKLSLNDYRLQTRELATQYGAARGAANTLSKSLTSMVSLNKGGALAKLGAQGKLLGSSIRGSVKGAMGSGISISMALSGAVSMLDKFSQKLEKSGDSTGAALAEAGTSALSMAATGAAVAGPWGAIAGIGVGLAMEGYNAYKDKKKYEAEAEKISYESTFTGQRLQTNKEILGARGFKSTNQAKQMSSMLSQQYGGKDYSEDIVKYTQLLRESGSNQEQANQASKKLAQIYDQVAASMANMQEFQKLSVKARELKQSLSQAKTQITNAINNVTQQLQTAELVNTTRDTLLQGVRGPLKESLLAQNQTEADFIATGQAKMDLESLKNELRGETDPEKRQELAKQIEEAGRSFREKIASSAANMVNRQKEIIDRMKTLEQERRDQISTITTSAFDSILETFKNGPLNFKTLENLGTAYKSAKTDEQKTMILAQAEEQLGKGKTKEQRNYLLQDVMGISMEELDRLRKSTSYKGGSEKQIKEFETFGENAGIQKNIADIDLEMNALKLEANSLAEKLKSLQTDFDPKGSIVDPIIKIGKTLESAGANLEAFKLATDGLTSNASRVTSIVTRVEGVIKANEATIKDLESKLGIVNERLNELRPQ